MIEIYHYYINSAHRSVGTSILKFTMLLLKSMENKNRFLKGARKLESKKEICWEQNFLMPHVRNSGESHVLSSLSHLHSVRFSFVL